MLALRATLVACLIGCVTAALAGQVQASAITVPNFSFELPAQNPGGNNSGSAGNTTAVTDWTVVSGVGGVFFPNGNGGLGNPLPAPADGSQYLFAESSGSIPLTSFESSELGLVEADTVYTLDVALGHRNTGIRLPDNYLVELLFDGNVVASAEVLDARSVIPAATFIDVQTTARSAKLDALVGTPITVRLTHSTDDGVARQGAFDNVRLDARPVPEPGTLGLLVCCSGVFLRRRWK